MLYTVGLLKKKFLLSSDTVLSNLKNVNRVVYMNFSRTKASYSKNDNKRVNFSETFEV